MELTRIQYSKLERHKTQPFQLVPVVVDMHSKCLYLTIVAADEGASISDRVCRCVFASNQASLSKMQTDGRRNSRSAT